MEQTCKICGKSQNIPETFKREPQDDYFTCGKCERKLQSYSAALGLQSHLKIKKIELVKNDRKAFCTICKKEIKSQEEHSKLLIKPESTIPNVHSLGGYYHLICSDCKEKLDS